jgi:hypothetical protein
MNNLTTLRDSIEKLEKIHQVHILKIFNKYNIEFTENTNGIFVNMTILNTDAINDIKSYIDYVKLQQKQLEKVEAEKDAYKKEFYKDNKAVASYNQ